jgi:hypothetical protein
MQRYFYGIIAVIFRFLTKYEVKRIPNGLPKITNLGCFGIKLEQQTILISKQFRGFKGEITINSLPPTTIPQNATSKRQVLIGCRLKGFLVSPNVFVVAKETFFEALRAKEALDYIAFLEKENADFFVFEKCFQKFKRKDFYFAKNIPLRSSCSNLVVSVKR